MYHTESVRHVFTVIETAAILQRVEGRQRALSARGVRYFDRAGMLQPSARMPGERGARLYTITDIAMLRLALLLRHRWKLSERAIWGVLVYRGDEVRAQVESGRGTIEINDLAA